MKSRNILLTVLAILGLVMLNTPVTQAQTCDGTGQHFVDLDGDGFNDNAPDADGDGIPNGLDEDYIKHSQDGTYNDDAPDADGDGIPNGLDEDYIKQAQDGTGYQNGKNDDVEPSMTQTKTQSKSGQFNRLQTQAGTLSQNRVKTSTGTGTGVCDGSGNMGTTGTGTCDGTGPNGSKNGKGK